MQYEIGCSTICFRHADFMEATSRIKAKGFRTIDIGGFPGWCSHMDDPKADSIKERIIEMGFNVAALNVGNGALNDEKTFEQHFAYLKECIDLAARLKCYAITVQAGNEVPRPVRDENLKLVVERLKMLSGIAEQKGINVTIEMPHKGSIISNVDEGLELLELLSDENIGIAFDTSHILCSGCDPVRAVSLYGNRILHVHLRDGRGKNPEMTPGEGDVDFRAVINALDKIGYKRPLILELEYPDKTIDEIDQEMDKAMKYIQGCQET